MTLCRTVQFLCAALAVLTLAACEEEAAAPAARALTDEAIGHYCGMMLTEHEGPKGQILLEGVDDPVWFSSARDAVAFTLLPEEPKDIAAIYVSDMGKAPSWADPGADNWTDARTASFVIGSAAEGGMGGAEAVPFADRAARRGLRRRARRPGRRLRRHPPRLRPPVRARRGARARWPLNA